MCGVIGYVGRRGAADRLLGAIERLEYRGYDSAGICLLTPRGLELVKAVGKLENLKRKADGRWPESTTGIGHTRWATHGRVTEENAHPAAGGRPRRRRRSSSTGSSRTTPRSAGGSLADGEQFASQTDAEVVAHLVRRAYRGIAGRGRPDGVRASSRATSRSSPSIAISPGLLVGTRRRCPLLVGLGRRRDVPRLVDDRLRGRDPPRDALEDDEIVAITAERRPRHRRRPAPSATARRP